MSKILYTLNYDSFSYYTCQMEMGNFRLRHESNEQPKIVFLVNLLQLHKLKMHF